MEEHILWWPRLDLNQRPLPCQGSALPTELRDHSKSKCDYSKNIPIIKEPSYKQTDIIIISIIIYSKGYYMNNIKSQTALITGATSGIGKATAKVLAKMGVNLVLTGRREQNLKNLKESLLKNFDINVQTLKFDVTDKNEVLEKLTNLLTKTDIDILINNAGLALGIETIDQGDIDNWEAMIDTNIKGLLYVSRVIIPHLREKNKGHIVNLGSIAGEITYPGGNVYCATKSAVHTLSEAMNIDLKGTDIRVSNIAPGAVKTSFSDVRFKGDKQKAEAVYDGYTPLFAEDIADLILYVLNAPLHVNIQHTLIMPTAQRNPYILHKKED